MGCKDLEATSGCAHNEIDQRRPPAIIDDDDAAANLDRAGAIGGGGGEGGARGDEADWNSFTQQE